MSARTAVALLVLVSLVGAGCSRAAPAPPQRSFEMGWAITSQCAPPVGNGFPAAFCEPLNAAVAELEAEQRDEAWASDMEKRIDEMFGADGKDRAEIRSLECRATMCAVEYAQDVNGSRTLDEMAVTRLLQWLEPATGGMGVEVSPPGHKVVSVMVWKKKSPAPAD